MRIDESLCIDCRLCLPYCPVGAIIAGDDCCRIDEDECVECGVCSRMVECPSGALYEPEEVREWPRSIRKVFSDPVSLHADTGVRGRGTEEVKTNDVTGRIKRGRLGIAVEMGRPGVGARFSDVEKMTTALVKAGVVFEPRNPLAGVMDADTGHINDAVLNEKALSILIEFTISADQFAEVAEVIQDVSADINTVFSWGIITRLGESADSLRADLDRLGLQVELSAKTNVGLGRPLTDL